MSPEQALKVLRNLVCDGVRAFDCQKALKTLEAVVLAQQPNNDQQYPSKQSCRACANLFGCGGVDPEVVKCKEFINMA